MGERGTYYLEPGAEPPGAYRPDGRGLSVWEGRPDWATRHGAAVVHWLLGRPHRIEGAATPDGARDVERLSPLDQDTWRRRASGTADAWILGAVAIAPDGVAFADAPPRAFEPYPEGEAPALEADLSRDAAFRERLGDVAFARVVYATLCNTEYRKAAGRRRWGCSWRSAGGLVADLRDRGEGYLDFYLGQPEEADGTPIAPARLRALTEEILGHYARLGWRPVLREEAAADHEVAMAALEAAETLPEGSCPSWAERYPAREARSPRDRAIMAARAGRVPEGEFEILMDNLFLGSGPEDASGLESLMRGEGA